MQLERWLSDLLQLPNVVRMLNLKNFFTVDQLGEFEFEEICQKADRNSSRGSLKLSRVLEDEEQRKLKILELETTNGDVSRMHDTTNEMIFQMQDEREPKYSNSYNPINNTVMSNNLGGSFMSNQVSKAEEDEDPFALKD